MKKLGLFIALALAATAGKAFAIDENNTWAEIYGDVNVRAAVPQVFFAPPAGVDADGTYYVPVTYVCVTADGKTLKTTAPVMLTKRIFATNPDGRTRYVNTVNVGEYILSTPRTYTTQVAVWLYDLPGHTGMSGNNHIVGYKDVTYTYALDGYMGDVYTSAYGAQMNGPAHNYDKQPLFTKEASIVPCAN